MSLWLVRWLTTGLSAPAAAQSLTTASVGDPWLISATAGAAAIADAGPILLLGSDLRLISSTWLSCLLTLTGTIGGQALSFMVPIASFTLLRFLLLPRRRPALTRGWNTRTGAPAPRDAAAAGMMCGQGLGRFCRSISLVGGWSRRSGSTCADDQLVFFSWGM